MTDANLSIHPVRLRAPHWINALAAYSRAARRSAQPHRGSPMKLRIPTEFGYRNRKHIHAIFVTNTYPGGYWEGQGYNWFGGS